MIVLKLSCLFYLRYMNEVLDFYLVLDLVYGLTRNGVFQFKIMDYERLTNKRLCDLVQCEELGGFGKWDGRKLLVVLCINMIRSSIFFPFE